MKSSMTAALAALGLIACAATPEPTSAAATVEAAAPGGAVSAHDFETTLDKLKAAIDARGFNTFAVIDHAAGAASVDLELRPTTLVIFGNPKGGTVLMRNAQTVGIDLPLKALVFEDADGAVRVLTSDIDAVFARHGLNPEIPVRGAVNGALAAITAEATQ
ncbi:MAG: DUF302 domain-containing protein [Pseudomonadota bacterium]